MLCRMRHLGSNNAKVWVAWQQMLYCMDHLESVLRSLTKPQRQEWASLLVTGLHRVEGSLESVKAARAVAAAEYFSKSQKMVLEDLMLFWCVDDDPGRIHEDVTPQLWAWQRSATFHDVRNTLGIPPDVLTFVPEKRSERSGRNRTMGVPHV